MPRLPKTKNNNDAVAPPATGSAGRLIVTYVDGTWTDNVRNQVRGLEHAGIGVKLSAGRP